MIKQIIFVLLLFLTLSQTVFADAIAPEPLQPLELCYKIYRGQPEVLYYKAISSINKNNFQILELQSKSGYILFRAYLQEFLLSISSQNDGTSLIKILPADGDYSKIPLLTKNLFAALDSAPNPAF